QREADHAWRIVAHHIEVANVALLLQNARDRDFHVGGGNLHSRVPRHDGIANASKHIRDRIGHVHGCSSTPRLPTRLGHARELATHRPLAETDAAESKLAQIGTRPATDLTAIVLLHLELGLAPGLDDHRSLCHRCPSRARDRASALAESSCRVGSHRFPGPLSRSPWKADYRTKLKRCSITYRVLNGMPKSLSSW